MQHYGVNGYSLHAMNSLSAMYNLHQQAAQQAQHAPDYRPSVHALTLAERLAGKNWLHIYCRFLCCCCKMSVAYLIRWIDDHILFCRK